MAHLQYMPGDPRLVDQLVYELKSKGIFDQFRKECIADVDTRPAYQNLRQRVENSVSMFLSRQCWKPDLNKNQLREKLRKHILDGNYLEQGVERIVDQVVNPKVASVFIPQVEDLVYNYLGISRKKSVPTTDTSDGKISTEDLLPTDLEAVSPGSVKSHDDKSEAMDTDIKEYNKMDVEEMKEDKLIEKKEIEPEIVKEEIQHNSPIVIDSDSSGDKNKITPMEEIKLENIPPPDNSPPKFDLEKIENLNEIPHPDEIPLPNFPKEPPSDKDMFFKHLHSDDDSSSDSSLRRNMSPLTPIRNYNNENSCDAQQAFDNDSDGKSDDKKEPSTFRFAIDAKSPESNDEGKPEKKDLEQVQNLSYQFNSQVNINTFNTPLYDDSSNSNNLQIDYESDANSKTNNAEKITEQNDHNSEDSKKDKKSDDKKSSSSSHKISDKSRDSHRHSSSKDKRSNSKQSSSRDNSRHDKKSKDDHSKSKSSHKEREKSKDSSEKKDSRDSSKHRSSSHKSSSHRDSKSHKSSTSSQRHSSDKKSSDDKRTSSSHKDRSERSSDKSSRDKKDSKSSSHRSDRDKKGSDKNSKSKQEEKDKKKIKKDTDDHYSLSGRGNHGRRSTDRDSNDGSSSSKGSQNHSSSKSTETKKESKESSSKSDNTSTSGESASPVDKEQVITKASDGRTNQKPIRVENHLEVPIASPPRLPFVPDVTLKKPKFAANLEEAKRMIKMRKFLDEEQKRMNQEAALLLEFQANVRPSLSQVYSSIPGPELEFACVSHSNDMNNIDNNLQNTEHIKLDLALTDTNNTIADREIKNYNEDDKGEREASSVTNLDETLIIDKTETYNENKPFSQLMDEISEISKVASEKRKDDVKIDNLPHEENKQRTEFFEITIITEELSETDEPTVKEQAVNDTICDVNIKMDAIKEPNTDEFLKYFAEHEKYEAEIKKHQYNDFLKTFTQKTASNKVYLLNCDTYEENILKEVYSNYGEYEIVNYYKNGYIKLQKTNKNVVKNVNVASEIMLPLDNYYRPTSPAFNCGYKSPSPVFSPVKSECSFELSSDYDAKLEEMVNKTSRQEVMEIILGSIVENDIPTIDYCMESRIDSDINAKRKFIDIDGGLNNNRHVLTKMRKLSDSDQISSTTEESEELSNINRVCNPQRSKYLGRARRVGLPRPKRNNQPNSPSSDKSVENYEQNTPATPQTPNGKMKSAPRNKVQRYDKSDLYKPKLHYLSRRNNIS